MYALKFIHVDSETKLLRHLSSYELLAVTCMRFEYCNDI